MEIKVENIINNARVIAGKIIEDSLSVDCTMNNEQQPNEDRGYTLAKRYAGEKGIDKYNSFDPETDYNSFINKLNNKKRKSSIKRIIYSSVSVAAAMIIGFTVYFAQPEEIVKVNNITATNFNINLPSNNSRAIIIDDKGVSYAIDSTTDSLLIGDKTILIDKSNNSSISYKREDSEKIKPEINTLTVGSGSHYTLMLSDGTEVILNAQSELEYPTQFTGKRRVVKLKGEAFFNVAHNKNKPFIVETEREKIEVFGTKFNVKSYSEDINCGITLVEGSVGVTADERCVMLKPNEKLIVEYYNNMFTKYNVDVKQELSWLSNNFDFFNIPLSIVVNELKRWYGVDLRITNIDLLQLEVTLFISKDKSFEQITDIITRSESIEINKIGTTYFISKGSEY